MAPLLCGSESLQQTLEIVVSSTFQQNDADIFAVPKQKRAVTGSHGQSMQAVLQWFDGELRQTGDESGTKLGMDSQDQAVLKTQPSQTIEQRPKC